MAKRRAQPQRRYSAPSVPVSEPEEGRADADPPLTLANFFAAPGGSLLILRAFLGVTFTFAGLQKLSNPGFFSATTPGSFRQQVQGSILTSPLHHLLSPALHASTLVAVVVSLGEVAVGLGTLAGLYGRVAAAGGMLLAFMFFLTVSFNDNPYYYGPDIVFLFAWTPLVIAGAGQWSLDGVFARRVERAHDVLRSGASREKPAARRRSAELERRVFLQKATSAGVVGAIGLVTGGIVAAIGRLAGGATPASGSAAIGVGTTTTGVPHGSGAATTTTPTTAATSGPTTTGPTTVPTPKGTRIGPATDVPVGGAATFTDPAQGVPALVVQLTRGSFRAFSAVCPHAGCQVEFDPQNVQFLCPCHGSTFNASSGAVERGPAVSGLSSIPIALGGNGELYVDG